MKRHQTLLTLGLILVQACASSPKGGSDSPSRKDIEPDYVLRERSPEDTPAWARDFPTFRDSQAGKGLHYYLGESGIVSDRIGGCEFADLQSKRRIAQQVASLITSKVGSTRGGQLFADVNGVEGSSLRRHFEDTVAGNSLAFLTGVRQQAVYWEARDYSKTGGQREVYLCSVLSVISDQDLKDTIRRTGKGAPEVVEDPEAKSVVKEAIKSLDQELKRFIPALSQ